jgi:hypothetical protein
MNVRYQRPAAIGLAALVAILTFVTAGHTPAVAAPPDGKDVTVVNRPTQPVPITGQVIVGSPVPVTQDGSWTVSLGETSTVTVANPSDRPVPVWNVEKSGDELIQFDLDVEVEPDAAFSTTAIPVPPGKRLLIEHISGDVRLPVGQKGIIRLDLVPASFRTDRVTARHVFPLLPAGVPISTGPEYSSHFLAQETRLFCEGASVVLLSRGPTYEKGAWAQIGFSGRLVDAPAHP